MKRLLLGLFCAVLSSWAFPGHSLPLPPKAGGGTRRLLVPPVRAQTKPERPKPTAKNTSSKSANLSTRLQRPLAGGIKVQAPLAPVSNNNLPLCCPPEPAC